MIVRKVIVLSTFVLAIVTGCGGCSSSDQTVDPGTNQNPIADAAAEGNGVTVAVSYQGQSATVDLGSIPTSTYKGVNLVKLSDLWTNTKISADRATLEFEFVAAADGFKPSDKGCADLSGAVLDKGYIDPTSRNLSWDESLGFKGCYSVKGIGQINAHASSTTDAGIGDATAE